jgi:transcription elongation GreA/GreB family factor
MTQDSSLLTNTVAPAVPQAVRELLDSGDFDGIDMLFLSAIEAQPLDVEFVCGTIMGLDKKKRARQAQELLELLVPVVSKKDNEGLRGSVSRRILKFWPDCREAREMLLAHLRKENSTKPDFEKLFHTCLASGGNDMVRTFESLETWLRFDIGTPVYLQSVGIGRIREVNLVLQTIKVDFSGPPANVMSFRVTEAARLLEVLKPGHFLRDKLENLVSLQQLAMSDSGELLKRIFASIKRPLTASDLKELLSGIVPAQSWTSWWNKAKNDPRLMVGAGARPVCTWSDSAEQADGKICEEFKAADAQKKLELAKKYMGRSDDISRMIVESLALLASDAVETKPGFSLETVMTLEARMPAQLKSLLTVDSGKLLCRPDAWRYIESIGDKPLKRKAVVRLKDINEDWREIYRVILRNEDDSQCIDTVFNALTEGKTEAGEDIARSVLASPSAYPGFFAWICKSFTERTELRGLAGVSFIRSAVSSLCDVQMKEYHAQIRKAFDPGQVCRISIGSLDIEQAREVMSMFGRDINLEPFRKDDFIRDMNLTFPRLNEPEHEVFYVSAAALAERQDEFKRIIQHDLPKNREEIIKAKEFGDLKENFEYHAARARQEMLSSRAKTLGDQLTFARVIDPSAVECSRVNVGTKAKLVPASSTGEEMTITILGPWDSDPSKNILSHLAPAAQGLMGAVNGEEREFHGIIYRIEEIKPWM